MDYKLLKQAIIKKYLKGAKSYLHKKFSKGRAQRLVDGTKGAVKHAEKKVQLRNHLAYGKGTGPITHKKERDAAYRAQTERGYAERSHKRTKTELKEVLRRRKIVGSLGAGTLTAGLGIKAYSSGKKDK